MLFSSCIGPTNLVKASVFLRGQHTQGACYVRGRSTFQLFLLPSLVLRLGGLTETLVVRLFRVEHRSRQVVLFCGARSFGTDILRRTFLSPVYSTYDNEVFIVTVYLLDSILSVPAGCTYCRLRVPGFCVIFAQSANLHGQFTPLFPQHQLYVRQDKWLAQNRAGSLLNREQMGPRV